MPGLFWQKPAAHWNVVRGTIRLRPPHPSHNEQLHAIIHYLPAGFCLSWSLNGTCHVEWELLIYPLCYSDALDTGTILYVAFFALGAGAVPGLIVPELTNARLRGMHSLLRPALSPFWSLRAHTCFVESNSAILSIALFSQLIWESGISHFGHYESDFVFRIVSALSVQLLESSLA